MLQRLALTSVNYRRNVLDGFDISLLMVSANHAQSNRVISNFPRYYLAVFIPTSPIILFSFTKDCCSDLQSSFQPLRLYTGLVNLCLPI